MMQWLAILGDVPVPVSTESASPLLLVLLWILVAAAVIGPIARYFRAGPTNPRTTQLFAEDPPERL